MADKGKAPATLQTLLDELSVPRTELVQSLPDNALRCVACGHRCFLPAGKLGICKVRRNKDGKLYVPWGYVAGLQCDPVEKKPFFHAFPGSSALSFGMLGCDYHCSYCQNWITSQALRDPIAGVVPRRIAPEDIVRLAQRYRARIVTSTYNEPLITSEWAVDIFRAARAAGLATAFVSNGNATPEVLEFLRPWVDLYKVDLKGFDDRRYRKLGGLLETVKRTIRNLVGLGIWVEVVTLLVPGFNDSPDELKALVSFLADVSPNIPWHVTAFHPDYKMTDRDATTVDKLLFAAQLGEEAGLRFVYVGNVPGAVGEYENTRCPHCRHTVVERYGYRILKIDLDNGRCPRCFTPIPGRWGDTSSSWQAVADARPRPIEL